MWRPIRFLPDTGSFSGILPWVIAAMVFLSGLAVAGALSLRNVAEDWRGDLARSATVQVVHHEAGVRERDAAAAQELLRNTPGVERVTRLKTTEMNALLEPWLGKGNIADDLPVPVLIDVTLKPGAALNLDALNVQLKDVAPHAELDDHQRWLANLLTLARSVQGVAALIILLVVLTTVAIVIFATSAGLAAQRETVELVHLMGAQDGTIANAFQWRFMVIGLQGGALGFLLVLAALFGLSAVSRNLNSPYLPDFTPSWGVILALLVLPLLAGGLTMLTARMTVLRTLKRLV